MNVNETDNDVQKKGSKRKKVFVYFFFLKFQVLASNEYQYR